MKFRSFVPNRESPLGMLLRMPLRLIPAGLTMPVLSGINVGMKWTVGAYTHACWLGDYEHSKQVLLPQLIKKGMVAYDIGAQAGFYTLAFSRLVGPTGRVMAFEPDVDNLRNLRRHVLLNNAANVTTIQAAVAEKSGLVGFGGTSALCQITGDSSHMVPSVGLDELIKNGLRAPDFVKMDIEGAEGLALSGARELIQRRSTIWIVETHSADLLETCRTTFSNAGYELTQIDEPNTDVIAVPR